MTPEQYYQRRPLKVAGELTGGQRFDQALAAQPRKGWVHSTSGQDAAALFDGQGDAQAVFWTDLGESWRRTRPSWRGIRTQ